LAGDADDQERGAAESVLGHCLSVRGLREQIVESCDGLYVIYLIIAGIPAKVQTDKGVQPTQLQ